MDFIVVAPSRSGSTMLCNYLGLQPDITCHYEIFGHQAKNQSFHTINICSSINTKIDLLHNIIPDLNPRDFSAIKIDIDLISKIKHSFINGNNSLSLINILKEYNPKKFIGFKILYNQIDLLINCDFFDYISKNNTKIVHLYRENLFLQSLSKQRKQQTNIGVLRKGENNTNIKITFNVNRYKKDILEITSKKENIINQINSKGVPHMMVSYEQLCGENKTKTFNSIVDFITDSNGNFIEIKNEELTFQKVNIFKPEEQILNFEDIKKELRNDLNFQRAIQS